MSAEAIAAFIDSHDANHIGGTAAPRVGAELDTITVVDPACGSGAFLLGMMQELVELRTALFRIESKPEDFHALKLHIIERNLYGVDIDEFAVNIAMLRLWLSLAIDFDGDTPPALPNLDFKIVRGDSLLGPDPSPDKYPDLVPIPSRSSRSPINCQTQGRVHERDVQRQALRRQRQERDR